MTIKNDQVPDADDITNLTGKIFKNQAQLIFNADLIGLDADLDEEYENLKRDILSGTSGIDTTNSVIDDLPIFGANVLDDFENASIDATIWTTATGGTGTVTETTVLNVTANGGGNTASATADGASTQDFNATGTIIMKMTKIGNANAQVKLIDQSANEVSIFTGTITDDFLRIEINPGTNTATWYTSDLNGDGGGTGVDITSLTDGDAWHLKFNTDGTGGPNNMNIRFVRWLANAAANIDFVSTATTASETITDAILIANKTIGTGASATYWLSADNGSNYESVTLNQIHRFANTGTQLKVKVIMTNATTDKVFSLNHYAVFYNIGAV